MQAILLRGRQWEEARRRRRVRVRAARSRPAAHQQPGIVVVRETDGVPELVSDHVAQNVGHRQRQRVAVLDANDGALATARGERDEIRVGQHHEQVARKRIDARRQRHRRQEAVRHLPRTDHACLDRGPNHSPAWWRPGGTTCRAPRTSGSSRRSPRAPPGCADHPAPRRWSPRVCASSPRSRRAPPRRPPPASTRPPRATRRRPATI